MEKIIVVSGHGSYASGIKSAIELIAGHREDVYPFDFTVNETDLTLKEKIESFLNLKVNSQVLFICDLLGGTTFKISAEIANYNDNMEVIVGCNVGSIIEGLFQKDMLSISELADYIVDASKKTTVKFKKITVNDEINYNLSLDDGI